MPSKNYFYKNFNSEVTNLSIIIIIIIIIMTVDRWSQNSVN